jgi:putative hydrolase of the HAD superfamily
MPLQAVLFDLDDTLHDKSATLCVFAKAQHASNDLGRIGIDATDWVKQFVLLNNERIEKAEVFARLAREFKIPDAVQSALLHDFDANLGRSSLPFPGSVELLQACRVRGLKIGLVTNGRDGFQRSKVAGMGMLGLFDSIVTSGGFGTKKPDHRIFMACLHELGVRPEDAAFVGDDFAADIQPSLEIGMHAIWKSKICKQSVAFCSDDLFEIQGYLQSLG